MDISLPKELASFVASKVRQGLYVDESDVIRDALRRLRSERIAGEGIEEGALLAMRDTVRSAQEDVTAILAEMNAINAAKRHLRELISRMSRDAAVNAGQDGPLDLSAGLGSESDYHKARIPVPDPEAPGGVRVVERDLWPRQIATGLELQAIVDKAKGDLDSLSEMGEMESLRLQVAMDRLSKMMSTLSNLLKKISDTAASITQNLK